MSGVTPFCTVRLDVHQQLHIGSLASLAEHLEAWGLANSAQEQLWVIALDGVNNIRTVTVVAIGDYHNTFVSIPTILTPVLLSSSDRFIIAHNHPNGRVTPTADDIDLTARVEAAADVLDMELDDHVIVGPHKNWCSMRALGHIKAAA